MKRNAHVRAERRTATSSSTGTLLERPRGQPGRSRSCGGSRARPDRPPRLIKCPTRKGRADTPPRRSGTIQELESVLHMPLGEKRPPRERTPREAPACHTLPLSKRRRPSRTPASVPAAGEQQSLQRRQSVLLVSKRSGLEVRGRRHCPLPRRATLTEAGSICSVADPQQTAYQSKQKSSKISAVLSLWNETNTTASRPAHSRIATGRRRSPLRRPWSASSLRRKPVAS